MAFGRHGYDPIFISTKDGWLAFFILHYVDQMSVGQMVFDQKASNHLS